MERFSRKDWGAAPAKSTVRLKPEKVTHLFLHHTTGANLDVPAWMRGIQSFHQGQRGWSDIAYNWLVSPDGDVYEGRGWTVQGGHTAGWNSRSVAVAYLGNGDRTVPNDALSSIAAMMDEADRVFGRKLIRQGHRDVGKTECPGVVLYAWLRSETRPPAPAPSTLRAGARGPEVLKLQQALGVAADGVFGSRTTAAVREFQRKQGMRVDGIVGPVTWTAIQKGGHG
jgi:hypothetical protein